MMIKLIYPAFWAKNGIISFLLTPLSWIYRLLGFLRRKLARPIRFDSVVICVGNISVGGTGKTQIVLSLAKQFKEEKVDFLVVTKGYGSTLDGARLLERTDIAAEVGDESVLLSEFAPVVAAKNIRALIPIIKTKKPAVIIFDDGLQNPNFIKDLTIVVIDSSRGIGNGKIFPAGPSRQSADSAIESADIITMVGNSPCQDLALINQIKRSGKPFFRARIQLETNIDKTKHYYAFTAIGDPDRFYNLLKEQNIIVKKTESFPDHHNYSEKEIDGLKTIARQNDYSLITTKKDYVKISNKEQIICADVSLDFENKQRFFQLIYEKLYKTS